MRIGEVALSAGVNVETLRYHERRGLLRAPLVASSVVMLALWVAAALTAVALGGACKIQGERRPYEAVGAGAEALRGAFNADAGKVRLIVLVAPT